MLQRIIGWATFLTIFVQVSYLSSRVSLDQHARNQLVSANESVQMAQQSRQSMTNTENLADLKALSQKISAGR